MIRRAFWLALGAVLGVTGYRRAVRRVAALLRPVRGLTGGGRALPAAHGPAVTDDAAPRRAGALARDLGPSVAGFLRDARDGMDDYLDSHARERTDYAKDGH